MTDNELPFDKPLPKPIVDAARELYMPPAGDGYWPSLEARIMASLSAHLSNSQPVRWWQVMSEWAQGGLVAAAAILIIVGLFLVQFNRHDIGDAYSAILQDDPVESFQIPSGVLSDWGGDGTEVRGATFRDVISR